MTQIHKIIIDERALGEISGIAQRYWHMGARPNQVRNVIEALRDYIIQRGQEPGFEVIRER